MRLNQWCEGLRGTQMVRELADKLLHGRVPESIETEEIHLIHRLFGGPFVYRHAVSGHKNAGAVVAKAAMHKNLLMLIFAEECEELRNLFIGRGSPAADRKVNEANAESLRSVTFPIKFFPVFTSKIHNRCDAQLLQLGEPVFFRLRSAKKNVVDFSCVVNSNNVQFLSVNRLNSRRMGRLRGRFFLPK